MAVAGFAKTFITRALADASGLACYSIFCSCAQEDDFLKHEKICNEASALRDAPRRCLWRSRVLRRGAAH